MSRIVGVHGAFHQLWGPHEVAARWVPALQDGLWRVGRSVDPNDVSICFYGDLFRRDPEVVGDEQWTAARAGAAVAHVHVRDPRTGARTHHLHLVSQDDPQWQAYLRLRELLRASCAARCRRIGASPPSPASCCAPSRTTARPP